jgi:hypothetical protein
MEDRIGAFAKAVFEYNDPGAAHEELHGRGL